MLVLLRSVSARVTGFLILVVAASVAVMAGLGYMQINAVTEQNAAIRIDRAARAAGALVSHALGDRFTLRQSPDGKPAAILIVNAEPSNALQPSVVFDRLVQEIAFVNQGASQMFRFNAATNAFDRLATSLRMPDGSPPPPMALGPAHPAYANLKQGHVYLGRVPLLGRMRYANLIPIVTANGDPAGALTFDVGWVDDLTAARDELREKILLFSGAILMLAAALGVGLMVFEMRPLRVIAKFANALATGTEKGQPPFTARKDEIGAVAQGLSRVVALQGELERLAYADSLTDLKNRAGYLLDLHKVMKADQEVALLHMDIDRFKDVNEAFGPTASDALLKSVGEVFRAELGDAVSVARVGGDDFTAILPFDGDRNAIAGLCERIVERVARPILLQQGSVQVRASIGVVLLPDDTKIAEEAHRLANLALREAKTDGRVRYAFYSDKLDKAAQKQIQLEHALRQALENGELTLHFQPQVRTSDFGLYGVEALARWPHAERGFISPGEFIPVAESTGLIVPLGAWVIDEACRIAREWLDVGFNFRQISVNVSPKQLWQPNFIQTVSDALGRRQLPGGYICLEVTESVFVDHNEARIMRMMQGLRDLGVSMALDDFGSGYSSLGYLNKLPFDQLKCDRGFISNVDRDPRKESVLRGIVALGKGLGLEIVAEGAERAEEATLLREMGCDAVQGYYFARPTSPLLVQGEVERIRRENAPTGMEARERAAGG